MIKKFMLIFLVIFILLHNACYNKQDSPVDSISAATVKKGPTARVLLKQFMPEAMADGNVKIAVLLNQSNGDNSRQFIDGCVSEGRSMGFTVDAFISDGEEKRCREIAVGIANADYDGLIFTHGDVGFSYDILKPVADIGIKIVCFEALPYRDGKFINGVITAFQDDYRLARLSLQTMLDEFSGEGRPVRVIRIGCDSGITFLDRRNWEFDRLADEGKITEIEFIKLDGLENPHGAAWEAVAAILQRYPPYSVDCLWVPWDKFAGGCAEALAAAGRQDIKIISIGISSEDIRLMLRHSAIWLASSAVDPKLAGTVTMRMLAALMAGETLSDTFSFNPQLVKTADLKHTVNIANLSVMMPDWEDGEGLFDSYQWMIDLKAAEGKYLRIPPVLSDGIPAL